MKDDDKTKEEILKELEEANKRIAELENAASIHMQAEQRLRETERTYRSLFENMLNGCAYCRILSDQGHPTDFLYLEVNKAYESLTGIKDVAGKKASEVLPGIQQTNPELFDILGRVALIGDPERFDIYVEALKRWFSVSAYSLEKEYFVIVFENITERKLAEKELRESEEIYRLITDNITDVIFTSDIAGTYTFISSSHKRVLERGEEVLGRSIFEHIHPEDTPRVMASFQEAVKSGQVTRIEARYLHPSRGYIWLESQGMLMDMHGTPTGVIVSRDITGRKQAEEALLREQSFNKALLDSLPGIFYLYSYPELRLVRWNRNHETLLGFGPGEIDNRHISEWHIPESKEVVRQAVELVMEKGQDLIEAPLLTKDGRQIPFLMTGVRLDISGSSYLLGVGLDITEHKKSEKALKESYTILKGVLESPKGVVIFALDRKYRYIAFNKNHQQTMKQIWGADIALGDSMLDYIKGHEDIEKAKQNFDRALSGESFIITEEYGDTDLERRYYEDLYNPIIDEKGMVIGLTLFLTDITDRRRSEEEREMLQAQLNQAQKMESVGRLAGGVAHDFNNMLSVIIGYSELALKETSPENPLYNNLHEIIKAAKRSSELTRQLLAFARKQTVSPKLLDLNETVGSILNMLRRLIGEDIDLTWLPDAGTLPIYIDPSQIDQILTNLCVNARDAISGVGNIIIETHAVTFNKTHCPDHSEIMPGEYVQLIISDNGCGMDKETLDKIFEPFFTTKESGKGTGLGLATIYGVIKQNDGHIYVTSKPGQGTSFRIYLPMHMSETTGLQDKTPAIQGAPGHETILLVEDEPAILDMAQLMLESMGYRVLSASTPGEAIHLAKEHTGEIHLMITDIVMPEMSGLDLAKIILSLHRGIRRLFMSGYSGDVIAQQNIPEEDFNFIQKPFSIHELDIQVRRALHNK